MQNLNNKIICGDNLEVLKSLPDEFVQTCITSPPYFGLRDYGTGQWEGGDLECKHHVGNQVPNTIGAYKVTMGLRPGVDASQCRKCGAIRIDKQIGLEKTVEDYVNKLVNVFREVKRVLKKDGTFWLNIGDSYCSSPAGNTPSSFMAKSNLSGIKSEVYLETLRSGHATKRDTSKIEGLKPKDLIGIPWMLAFSLREDGWYLRQEIIWAKPNPMPESVMDRCTKSHEQIFLFSKSRQYYFDHEAIKEPSMNLGNTKIRFGGSKYGDNDDPKHQTKSGNEYHDSGKRNKRSVWTVNTKPYKGAHFATFPPKLIEPCVLAGSKPNDIVLDPFAGSGVTGAVAKSFGRKYFLIELNPEYISLINKRLSDTTTPLPIFDLERNNIKNDGFQEFFEQHKSY